MKFGIQTWGSEGDIRPFLALGAGLQAAGHTVTLSVCSIANTDYQAICDKYGLQYLKIAGQANLPLQSFVENVQKDTSYSSWPVRLTQELFQPVQEELYTTALQLCEENDVVINHWFMAHPMKAAALKTKTPFVSMSLCHALVPSKYRAPGILPNLGESLNSIQWKFVNKLMDDMYRSVVQAFYQEKGFPPVGHLISHWQSDYLNLVAVTSGLCQSQSDWKNNYVTGCLDLPDASTGSIPDSLKEFIHAGPPPVFMTLGGFQEFYPGSLPAANLALFEEAAKIAGCRAVIQVLPELFNESSIPLEEGPVNDNIYRIGRVSYKQVFPLCAAIVHHCGSGTLHQTLSCGCPSIPVSLTDEHAFWAYELQRLGVAPKSKRRQEITANELAGLIRSVVDSPKYRERAIELQQVVQQEDGVKRAVQLLTEIHR